MRLGRCAKILVVVALVVVVLGMTACSGSDGGSNSLSSAFCNDLRSGLSPFQILSPFVSDGTYSPSEAADRAYGFAKISCPEQLRSNDTLRTYLENWNIDPDD